MKWLRKAIIRWLYPIAVSRFSGHELTQDSDEFPFDTQFAILKATNGVLLRVTKYRPTHGHQSDFQHEIHIVKDDETVVDVVRRILVLQHLEK
jgi:hypothetical protein